ncbi:MAG: toprim domain-containing protein, partial [Prevotella sp.]|nr:toprim domain-containing protein [Prevotella sp.]
MAELTYDDFKNKLSIQDVLIDAGYTLNRRDGLRYPSYVRLDSEGRRIRGDKFIVTANGLCCFQPPTRKNYNVISFIKEHPEMFSDYTAGMDKDRLVNLVCNRLLNNPIEEREKKIINPQRDLPPFKIDDYKLHRFDGNDRETQKPFYPYFQPRGINLSTQYAFHHHFVLAERTVGDQTYKNLSFPMTIPGSSDGKIVGLEERGRRKQDGTSYKGMARGSNASEGLWIASPMATKLQDAKRVFIFESAFDAMAFYQMLAGKDSNLTTQEKKELVGGVYASTGGNPSAKQFEGLLKTAKEATFHMGFDMDDAGMKFADMFRDLADKANIPSNRVVREETNDGYKDFNEELLAMIERKNHPLAKGNVPEEYKAYVDSFRKGTDDIPSTKDVLHPNSEQIDLLPKSVQKLYARYEALYEDAYEMRSSRLVAPCDKEEAINQASEAWKTFKESL